MALPKQIVEVPAMDGLQQKTSPQRLPPGKSAKAINLQKNKQGRLDKRLGLIPLSQTDPFGSTFLMTSGVQLGTWSDGTGPDNLIVIGRGNRPNMGAANFAGVVQMYSDDLGGPLMTGYGPELSITSDGATSGSQGSAFSPCQATIGDLCVQVWIDPAYNFAAGFNSGTDPQCQPPVPPVGPIYWSALQMSTGQTIVPPAILDTTVLYAQCVRIIAVGNTFIVCYSAAGTSSNPTVNNGYIFAKTMSLATLEAGGQFSPAPGTVGTTVVSNNAAVVNPYGGTNAGPVTPPLITFFGTGNWAQPGGYFDLQAIPGNTTNFMLAYATGTFTLNGRGVGGQWTGTDVVVDQRAVSAPGSLISQWVVESIPGTVTSVGGFGLRVGPDTNHNEIVLAWAFWDTGVGSYQIKAAIGTYAGMTTFNTSTIIYRAFDGNETSPAWLSVKWCTQQTSPLTYVVSHSPLGSCWNAAFSTAAALGTVGVGATAQVNYLDGFLTSVTVASVSSGNFTSGDFSNLVVTFIPTDGKGHGAQVNGVSNTNDGWYAANYFVGGAELGNAGTGYDQPPSAIMLYIGAGTDRTPPNLTTTILGNIDTTGSGVASAQITITDGGSGYSATNTPTVTFGSGGAGTGAVITPNTFTAQNGIQTLTISAGGSGYDANNPPVITVVDTRANYTHSVFSETPGSGAVLTPIITGGALTGVIVVHSGSNYSTNGDTKIYVSGGATGTAIIANGAVTGIQVTQQGTNYPSPPTVTISSPQATTPLFQSSSNRLGGVAGFTGGTNSTQLWYPSNNARIIQNMIQPESLGNPVLAVQWLCGGTNVGQYPINTSGVTLASDGVELNGIIYYLGWVPSLTQGTFVVLAFDLACAINITGSGGSTGLNGNVFPMRPVGILQKMTALADPGWGYQPNPLGPSYSWLNTLRVQSATGPNCWTGGSSWGLFGDSYVSASVTYATSSQGARLSPAQGVIQFQPAQGFYTAKFGNLTAIAGALPGLFDGQNEFEQGFIYSPEGILASLYKDNGNPVPGNLTWSTPFDSYTWIFTWEHFDAQGNFHISNRASITITGQDILDSYGPGTLSNSIPSLPYTTGVTFRIPNLGVTNRQWPAPLGAPSQPSWFGSDLRAYAKPPSSPVTLGAYRTTKNAETYYRIYDRFFNGDDIGANGFSLGPVLTNSFYTGGSGGATGQVACLEFSDGLGDTYIEDPANTFPLLYTDGTNGNPGSLDNYSPPATNVLTRHQERLFIADGNLVMFTKQRGELSGPGYNTTVNSIYVGGDDPVTALASMDDKLVIFKQNQVYYVSGAGPADDGTGSNFSDPMMIPTDAGCINQGSVIPTPEGVYFMSDAGLRIVTRSLSVEYVGGPVEDELASYPVVTGAVLYPSANKVLFLANQNDTNVPLVGEVLVRDYVLDAWTTTQFINAPKGFIASAIAYTAGSQGDWNTSPGLAWHVLDNNGLLYRERNPNDTHAYYDIAIVGGVTVYVNSTWLSPPIRFQDLSRARVWDLIVWGVSKDPHGIILSVGIDFGAVTGNKTWTWAQIAPGGSTPLPLTELRSYDGRVGQAFQLQVQDVSDPSSVSGQGFQVLGLSVAAGLLPGPFKLPPGSTQ